MFIVGPKEAEQTAVAVRDRIDGDLGPMPLADAIAKLKEEVEERRVRQVAENTFEALEGQTEQANEY
ncbi:MAG: His/Gly/Thr/Pro-type tRNA ligase C-terminal domain-containing protein, partial [Gimesia chilikensis]